MAIRTTRLSGFSDALVAGDRWEALRRRSGSDVAFLTREWLESWWQTLGHGELLLLAALRDEDVVGAAPFVIDDGEVSFLGARSADAIDFLGDVSSPEVLDALLAAAIESPGFRSFRLDALSDVSPTVTRLRDAAERLGLAITEERDQPSPTLPREGLPGASMRKSLLRHERFFSRTGSLEVRHLHGEELAGAELEPFFEQHVARWAQTPYPSLFTEHAHRRFYETLAATGAGWLRFTAVEWEGRPIAFHFGFSFAGSYLWYKPSFDIALARRSPGEVLLRRLFLEAWEEGATTFDFGLGDEPFKYRFATASPRVRTWRLRPS
jgi:CelD/BcsL family acetyltransferase involved in cellulose biosynthesis